MLQSRHFCVMFVLPLRSLVFFLSYASPFLYLFTVLYNFFLFFLNAFFLLLSCKLFFSIFCSNVFAPRYRFSLSLYNVFVSALFLNCKNVHILALLLLLCTVVKLKLFALCLSVCYFTLVYLTQNQKCFYSSFFFLFIHASY